MNKWITTLQFETEFDPTTLSNEEIASRGVLVDRDIEHAITRAIKTVDKLAEHFPELRKADPKAKLFDLSELFDPSAAASDLGKKNL